MADLSSITLTLPRWWKAFIYGCAIVNAAGIRVNERWATDVVIRHTRFEIG